MREIESVFFISWKRKIMLSFWFANPLLKKNTFEKKTNVS